MLTTGPTPEGFLDDGGGVLAPDRGRGMRIPFREARDARSMWRMSTRTVSKDPRPTDLRVRMLNRASTMLSHEAPLRMK